MEKVELRTADIAAENAAKLAELFPDIVTEVLDEDGNVRHSIDVEALKAHVGDIAEDKRERYQFTWPGKQRARAEAIRAIDKTMRPCPEESVNWDTTENLYIEGDNLDALKILRETYAGKIKMIYIDPPYNTGHDFVYNDDFARSAEEERAESGAFDEDGNVLDAAYKVNNESNGKFHSDWCSMMYPRLVLARDLLSEDGVIFISIDDGEANNAQAICNDVFGSVNFITRFIWRKVDSPNDNHVAVTPDHEYILTYAACAQKMAFRQRAAPELVDAYNGPDKNGRYWRDRLLRKNGKNSLRTDRPTMFYPLIAPDGTEVLPIREDGREGCWAAGPSSVNALKEKGDLIWKQRDGSWVPYSREYAPESPTKPWMTIWSDLPAMRQTKAGMKSLFGTSNVFDTPKPPELIERLALLSAVTTGDTVLDFFSGSAATAHACMLASVEDGVRPNWIMVQLPEQVPSGSDAAALGYSTICEIGKERIRRAGAKIAAEVEESNAQLKLGEEPKHAPDIGFRVLKIDSSNFEDVARTPDTLFQDALFSLADNVKPGRTPEDILFQLFPKLEIPYTARIDTLDICGKTVYSVDDDTLVACFDREVPEDVVRAMAEREPAWAVLRDASFTGDDALANFEEIFKTLSPETKTRVV